MCETERENKREREALRLFQVVFERLCGWY